jgi:hypothetical protein
MWAWAVFALSAALVTWWIHATVPSGGCLTDDDQTNPTRPACRPAGAVVLMIASFVMGFSSIAV